MRERERGGRGREKAGRERGMLEGAREGEGEGEGVGEGGLDCSLSAVSEFGYDFDQV